MTLNAKIGVLNGFFGEFGLRRLAPYICTSHGPLRWMETTL